MKQTLTLRDGEPVVVELDDIVAEERLHQGLELWDDTPFDVTELTMKSGLKIQVQETPVVSFKKEV